MEKKVMYYLVNTEGKIIKEIYNTDKVRLRTQEQAEYYKEHNNEIESEKVKEFGQDNSYLRVSTHAIKDLREEKLSALDYNIALLMMSHTNYTSGLIAHSNNKPITLEWLHNNIDAHSKSIDNSIRKLIKSGIICKGITADTRYFFNPYIGYRGRYVNSTLVAMFKASKWCKRVI